MKKTLILQITLLVVVVVLGLTLKNDLGSGVRSWHKLAGGSAGLVSMLTAILAFRSKQSQGIRLLTISIVILIGLAGIGGSSLYKVADYNSAYGLMVGSGSLALLASMVLFFKTKNSSL